MNLYYGCGHKAPRKKVSTSCWVNIHNSYDNLGVSPRNIEYKLCLFNFKPYLKHSQTHVYNSDWLSVCIYHSNLLHSTFLYGFCSISFPYSAHQMWLRLCIPECVYGYSTHGVPSGNLLQTAIYSQFSQSKWWFSIAMSNCRRISFMGFPLL